jgi:flagellar hook-basal body complex protein FliE
MTSIDHVQHDLLARMGQLRQAAQQPLPSSHLAGGAAPGFVDAFEQALRAVDGQQHSASQRAARVDSGQSDDLMGAMLESQKASVSFSALMQVRNKLTSAFEEIMRTPM